MSGKPSLSKEEVDIIFRKLEPYLKTGLSLNKSCVSANVPKSTVYDLYNDDGLFAEKIDASKNYLSVVTSSIIFNELERIFQNQKSGVSANRDDHRFVQWFATNHKVNTEEYCPEYRDPHEMYLEKANQEIDKMAEMIRKLGG